ncbi:MAG: hypothetical protein U9Q22_07775 [Candidatus Altiarchaeota archaeon]|nr:hypothetical protein [Candidatus Altiarchaeota archaeon]
METEKAKTKGSSMPRVLTLGILLVLCLVNTSSAGLVNSTNTMTIQVEVAEKTLVAIHPNSLSWTGTDAQNPGTDVNITKAIQIENIGSTNITKVWLNTTYPGDSPFGSGDPLEYNAGNFVVIRRNESGSLFYYANRMEYNESELIYLTLASGVDTHGRFRNGNREYFWALKEDESGSTNCTNGTFYMGTNPHNESEDGTTTLTSCEALTETNANASCRYGALTEISGTPWNYADVIVDNCSGTCWNYTIAVHASCDRVLFYHWNMDAPGALSGASYPTYLRNTTLCPGANFIANVGIRVPYGTAAGTMTAGTLTITVQATES